jgi:HYDIN/CFA65/VesB-like, Ig-like domain
VRRLMITALLAVPLLGALPAAPAAFADTPSVTFSPKVVTFGHVPVGTMGQKAVTLTNTSSEPLTVNGYEVFSEGPSFSGNFTLNPGTCMLFTTLAPGEACTFTVLTSPLVAGPLHGQFCYTMIGAMVSDRECGRLVGAAS